MTPIRDAVDAAIQPALLARIAALTAALQEARDHIADDLAITIDRAGFGGGRSCVLAGDMEVIEEIETLLLTIDAALAGPT